MRIRISFGIALFLLAAPLFADDSPTVILTMKVHVNSTTKVAYNGNWSGPGSILAAPGTQTLQSSDQVTWSADHTETWQCDWFPFLGITALMCGDPTVVSDGASVHGGGSASEAWSFPACADGSGYGQASWQYPASGLDLCDEHELLGSGPRRQCRVDPWIEFLAIDLWDPPGTGTTVATGLLRDRDR